MVVGTRIAMTTLALTLAGAAQPALADGGQTGTASYYWQGKGTASGERFNPNAMTAAHRTLPFGTKVKVTNLRNGRSVVVRINDRGPFIRSRVIDVSRAAAGELGFTGRGLTQVRVAVVGSDEPLATQSAAAEAPETPAKGAKGRTQVAELIPVSTDRPASVDAPVNGGWTLVPAPASRASAPADTQTP
ncbi:MAG: septal ring lytic transglycosylase RlpA family protein [Pseudomonadota bacterium]